MSSNFVVGLLESSTRPILQFQLANLHPSLVFLLPNLMWADLLGLCPLAIVQLGLGFDFLAGAAQF